MIENIVRQDAQPGGDDTRVVAQHRLGVALLHQLLHFIRLMQTHRDMLLQIQRDLEGAQ